MKEANQNIFERLKFHSEFPAEPLKPAEKLSYSLLWTFFMETLSKHFITHIYIM